MTGINLLVKSKAFQYVMCKSDLLSSDPETVRQRFIINLFNFFPVTTDVVVAINSVWILVETYTLNSE